MERAFDLRECTAVVFTQSPWHEVPRARHQIARQLARFCPVVFAETPTDWRARRPTSLEWVGPNILRCAIGNTLRVPRRVFRYVNPWNRYLQRTYVDDVLGASKQSLHGEIVLVNFNPDVGELAADPRFALSVYFCNDDFSELVHGALARRAVNRLEGTTASNSDLCLSVSYPLVEKLAHWNQRSELFLPGHDIAISEAKVATRVTGAPTRVGYMGFINDRVDFAWLQHAANQHDMIVELAGPVRTTNADLQSLLSSPRVRHHGTLRASALQAMLEDCDVLVMPYRWIGTGMGAATAPNKLFAYLAVRKPVVISNMPRFLELAPGILYRAGTADQFVDAIRRARAEDNDKLRALRGTIAAENTWDVRGDTLRSILETGLATRDAGRDAGVAS